MVLSDFNGIVSTAALEGMFAVNGGLSVELWVYFETVAFSNNP